MIEVGQVGCDVLDAFGRGEGLVEGGGVEREQAGDVTGGVAVEEKCIRLR